MAVAIINRRLVKARFLQTVTCVHRRISDAINGKRNNHQAKLNKWQIHHNLYGFEVTSELLDSLLVFPFHIGLIIITQWNLRPYFLRSQSWSLALTLHLRRSNLITNWFAIARTSILVPRARRFLVTRATGSFQVKTSGSGDENEGPLELCPFVRLGGTYHFHEQKPEIPVWKSNGSGQFVWEASGNMSCDLIAAMHFFNSF